MMTSKMKQIQCNGELKNIPDAFSIQQLIDDMGLADKRIAVQVNDAVVPKHMHATQILETKDIVEVVQAIGGG